MLTIMLTKALYEVLLKIFLGFWLVSIRIELFPDCEKLWSRVVYNLL